MNDHPRDNYEILDLIFTFLFAVSMVVTAIFLSYNLIISLIFIVVIILFSFVTIYFWITRNPFNLYLVRAFAFTNFLVNFIALIILSRPSDTQKTFQFGLVILLFSPSVIYLLLAILFSSISLPLDKKAGAALAYYGKIKNVDIALAGESLEDKKRRKEAVAQLKTVYRYKLIIILSVLFPLISVTALIIGSF
jgi:hypothetical protein